MLEELYDKRVNEASRGREYWLKLIQDYNIKENEYVLLLPTDCEEDNYYSLYYLERFLRKKDADRAIVLSVSEKWKQEIGKFSKLISDIVTINKEDTDNLLVFYRLYNFSDHLIIGSLTEPEGRLGVNLIGHKGITREDAIKVTLYDITE